MSAEVANAGVPSLSVVTVTWNSESVIAPFLDSLGPGCGNLTYELIVVDNASSDSTVAKIRSRMPDAELIVNPDNRGLAAANNQGLAVARAPVVAICNPDVIFHPGALKAMTELLARRPRAGWVVPRMFYESGEIHTSAGRLPTLSDAVLGRIVARWLSRNRESLWLDGWAHDEEREIGRGHEAAYMVRRQAVDQVGNQDERFVLDWEGPDWMDRFMRTGWGIWLCPDAEVVHLGGASIRQVPFRWIVSTHRGMYYYFSDRRPAAWRPVLAAVFATRGLLKAAMTMARLPMYEWAHRGLRRAKNGTVDA